MRRTLILLAVGAVCLALPGNSGAVSMKTTRFVAGFEGFISCVYADPAGHATIGYGHLLHYGPPTRHDKKKWGCLSNARALKLLRKDLKATEDEVLERIEGAEVSPSMITALTSFAFNLGAGALDHRARKGKAPATDIALNVREGRYRRAGKQMLLYDGIIVDGKRYELEGLRIRRRKEYHLMLKDMDSLDSCQKACSDGPSSGGIGSG